MTLHSALLLGRSKYSGFQPLSHERLNSLRSKLSRLMLVNSYAQLYGSGSLWVDKFQMIELTEVMRQRGDSPFSELLCRVRTNSCTSDDIYTLKSRTRALKCKTLGGNHIHHALSHIEQQASIHTMVYTAIDRLCIYCACACECLTAPSRTSPVSRLFHAG